MQGSSASSEPRQPHQHLQHKGAWLLGDEARGKGGRAAAWATPKVHGVSCACGLALLSSELSPCSACWENSVPQVCYLPFSLSNICHPGKKIPSGSWHGKLNSCLNQQEAAPEDGCPAFGSNIALVIDRANSACPLPSYNLITYTLPRAGLSLPAGDVFILGCPALESDSGLLPCLCLPHEAEPPCAISGP